MRSRVAKCAEGIQRLDRLLSPFRRIDTLRLVDDDDRPRGLDEFYWLAPRQLVAFLVDDIAFPLCFASGEILAKCIDIDHENLQRVACGELPQPVHLPRIVDEVLEGQIIVESAKVFCGDLYVLEHTLTNCYTRHHHDEFLKAVTPR